METGWICAVGRGARVFFLPRWTRADTTNRYLEDTLVRLRNHLGLVFHRILSRDTVSILIDVEYSRSPSPALRPVEPIDPFGYLKSGATGIPSNSRSRCLRQMPASTCTSGRRDHNSVASDSAMSVRSTHRASTSTGTIDCSRPVGGTGSFVPTENSDSLKSAVDVNDRLANQITMNPRRRRYG